MEYWADFYESIFNFREIRYFDIKGEYTGLLSKALTAPDGKIRIPLNEEASQGVGQWCPKPGPASGGVGSACDTRRLEAVSNARGPAARSW